MTEHESTSQKMASSDLDELFAAARRHPPELSDALRGRIVDDAAARLPLSPQRMAVRASMFDWLRAAFQPLGGLGVATAMASAVVVGIWIGLKSPVALEGTEVFYGETDLYLTEMFADLSYLTEDM